MGDTAVDMEVDTAADSAEALEVAMVTVVDIAAAMEAMVNLQHRLLSLHLSLRNLSHIFENAKQTSLVLVLCVFSRILRLVIKHLTRRPLDAFYAADKAFDVATFLKSCALL